MAPNKDSAAAAVANIQTELDALLGALEGFDRKAALVPTVLGIVAGIFIAPETKYEPVQLGLLASAIVTGILAVGYALRVLWAQHLKVGPNAQQMADGTSLDAAVFHAAVARSLANAVDHLTNATRKKARWFNLSISFGAVTILLLALTRVLGGS